MFNDIFFGKDTAKMQILYLVTVFLVSANLATKDGPKCTGIVPHQNGSLRNMQWILGKSSINILLTSKSSYASASNVLTGAPPKPEAAKDACFKVSWKLDMAKGCFTFALHGFKAIADYECTFAGVNATKEATMKDSKSSERMCKATNKSTNKEWASRLEPGRPMTVMSDDKTYALDVRCPEGKERMWYVKSTNKTLDPSVKEMVLKKVKELGLEAESCMEVHNEKCPDL